MTFLLRPSVRMIWTVLASTVAAYAGVLILVYVFQSRLVYFPETGRAVAATPQAYGLRFEPVTIETEDNERLSAWWVPAENALGAVLFFHGNAYPVSVGGLSAGLVFGASRTSFHGTVSNIRSPYDVSGTYVAVGGGAAVLAGGQVLVLQNEKGAQLRLSGKQIGLQVNIDFSGLAITVK